MTIAGLPTALLCPLKQLIEAYAIVQSSREKNQSRKARLIAVCAFFSPKVHDGTRSAMPDLLWKQQLATVDAEGHLHASVKWKAPSFRPFLGLVVKSCLITGLRRATAG
jgi:hypothetical protein